MKDQSDGWYTEFLWLSTMSDFVKACVYSAPATGSTDANQIQKNVIWNMYLNKKKLY